MRKELALSAISYQLSDKVVFTGLRQDVPKLLQAVDILVMPSLREGLPIAALEAMAAGVSVVATNVGGTPEVVEDGITGILVKPKDSGALLKGLLRLLENKELSVKMKENASIRLRQHFSLEKMIAETEALYLRFATEKIKR